MKRSGGCWSCGGDHFKHDCKIWRQTIAGKAWLASAEGKAKLAEEGKGKAHAVKTLRDSDSESEASTYPPSDARVKSSPQWYLDSCASVHITPCRDQFITKLSPSRLLVEIADGSEVRSKGKGDVRISYISHEGRAQVNNNTRGTLCPRSRYQPTVSRYTRR